MAPSNFPLRWESTGDKWWYACPIDWAAANGHYDLLRELLLLDGNHLIKLTSLHRVHRLEAVWDDEEQFDDVAKCRCDVAHQLFNECNILKDGRNSLIIGGYGGWLLYTAASAGDLGFVQEILEKYPLLVFGEGEYGLTDILYAASRSKNHEVFKVVYDLAVSPRFVAKNNVGDSDKEEHIMDVSEAFKLEVKNRAALAAARGGSLSGLKLFLAGCSGVLEYKDVNGSTVLHAAAGRGQVEVVNHLVSSYDMIASVDVNGNTALHIAAYKGHLSVLEVLVQVSPSSASVVNKAGNTFLHMAVAGFQTPGFRRLDRQIELMKHLVSQKYFSVEDIINSKNNEGRTALHLAIVGNVHSKLVELLMTARCINLNVRDDQGVTPLDYLKRQPRSSSSEILIRQLISAGGISSCKDFSVRKAFASQLKLQGGCSSPGTSFRVSDSELLQCTGSDHLVGSELGLVSGGHLRSFSEVSLCDSTDAYNGTMDTKKSRPLRNAATRFKTMFQWSSRKRNDAAAAKKMHDSFSDMRLSASGELPVSLRERYSNPSSVSVSKRTLAARSNISGPCNRKKFASGVVHDVLHEQPLQNLPAQSPSDSFSSQPLNDILKKGKETNVEDKIGRQRCLKVNHDDDHPQLHK